MSSILQDGFSWSGASTALLVLGSLSLILVTAFLFNFISSPVKAVPGPLLARFSNLYRLLMVWRGSPEQEQAKLHEQYGSAVALGPNLVSISDPHLIKVIYSRKDVLPKSEFYSVSDVMVEGRRTPSALSIRDENLSSQMMRPYLRLVTPSNVLKYEHLVDKTINFFMECMDKRFVDGTNAGNICDMDNYLHYFAWDVIAETTFSHRMGFIEQAKDVDGMLAAGYTSLDYMSLIGQMPILDNFLDKNPVYSFGPPNFGSAIAFSAQRLADRLQGIDKHDPATNPDFLDGFLQAQRENPDVVDQNALVGYMLINVGAGSDTTASILRAAVYNLATNQDVLRKLQAELDSNAVPTTVSWTQARSLLYLDAVVRETLRYAPSIPHLLERVVGTSGLQLPNGTYLSSGTVVGVNSYVSNRDKGVFGEDADTFRPERWLRSDNESEDEFMAKFTLMRDSDFSFGAGKRMCAGRHLALLEFYKLVASLCKAYDFELAPNGRKWKTQGNFVMLQTGLDLVLKRRGKSV